MVDISYSLALDVIRTLGIIVGIAYYLITLRNQTKTRRIQLLTQLSERYKTIEGNINYFTLLNAEWTTYDEFERKYGSDNNLEFVANRYSAWGTYNDLGYLVKQGFIDLEDVYVLMSSGPLWVWHKYESVIFEQRKRYNGSDWLIHFEELAKGLLEMKIKNDPTYIVPSELAKYIPSNET